MSIRRGSSTDSAARFLAARKREPSTEIAERFVKMREARLTREQKVDRVVPILESPLHRRAKQIRKLTRCSLVGIPACRDSLGDLPAVRHNEFGWVAHQDPITARCRVLWYGADDHTRALCAWCRDDDPGIPIPHRELRRLPLQFVGPRPYTRHPNEGAVYAIATVPDIRLSRLKVGWTTGLGVRMSSYITLAPTALVLGVWTGCVHSERRAHSVVDGRIGASEVFECHNVWSTIEALARAMVDRCVDCDELAALSDEPDGSFAIGAP